MLVTMKSRNPRRGFECGGGGGGGGGENLTEAKEVTYSQLLA